MQLIQNKKEEKIMQLIRNKTEKRRSRRDKQKINSNHINNHIKCK